MELAQGSTGNLPLPLSSLVGREQEQADVTGLLEGARLVSLVGIGGCGKTRLAQAVASGAAGAFADGAWWVELGPLAGEGLVAAVVAATIEAPQAPGEEALALLVRHLRRRQALVVLDNCEHVVDEAAAVAEQLLRSCPEVRILATSREVLGVAGEQVVRLGGLDTASAGTGDAVSLFVERARAAVAGYAPGPDELEQVRQLCVQLDGLPLGIELAAARVSVLAVGEIAARLRGDSPLLRHPSRSAPRRHQTLEDALDWSHRLLEPDEQVLFRRLGAFHGTFSLLAVESVAGHPPIRSADVLGVLGGLVDKSLVQVAARGAEHRYSLLETVHHYASSQLAASADLTATEAAHADFYLGLARQAHAGLEGPDQVHWLGRLDLEHDNLRSILRRHLPVQPEVGGALAALLWPFWYRKGYYHEARAWLEQAVTAADSMSPAVAAEALTGAGVLAFLQCDYLVATERLDRALELHHQLGHRVGVATVQQRLGSIAREQGRYDDARRLHLSARDLWSALGDDAGVAASEDYLCFVAWLEGDHRRAEAHGQAALAYFEAAGRQQETAAALVNLGATAELAGDDGLATERLRRALGLSRQLGYLEGAAWSLHLLGTIEPDAATSAALLCESLAVHRQLGDRWRVASVLASVACRVLSPLDPGQATRLLGAADALRTSLETPVPPAERPLLERAVDDARRALGAAAFDEAWAAGRSLTFDEATELADGACRSTRPKAGDLRSATPEGIPTGELTDREVEVLRLIGRGLTNRQIGETLFISAGTAGVHVSNILRKLGVSSRVQAAALAQRLGLGD